MSGEIAQEVNHRDNAGHHRRTVDGIGEALLEELTAASVGEDKTEVFEMRRGGIVLSHLLQERVQFN